MIGAVPRSTSMLKRRSEIIYRRMLLKLLQRNHEANAMKGYPRFCVRPGDVVGDDIIIDGLYEEDLLVQLFSDVLRSYQAWFRESTAIDIGANIGNHSLFMSRYFNKVCAFEPNETSLHILRANLLINQIENVLVFDCGLGSECEGVTFMEYPNSLGMSHFIDNNLDYQGARKGTSHHIMKRYCVQCGDEVLRGQEDISLIKLDCEGYEVPALRGLRGTLYREKPLVLFESCSSEGPSGSKAIMALLEEAGYGHFYTYEWRLENRAVVALTRMKRELRPIVVPEDRYYSLLIASYEKIVP